MTITVQNEHLALTIDDRGVPVSLRNLATRCEYLDVPGLDFWQMIYPHEDDPEMPIRSCGQARAEVANDGVALVVRYPHLLDVNARRLDVAFSYRVELRGEELLLTAEIRNAGTATINELWFPMVSGLRSMGGSPAEAFLLYPESAGRRMVNPVDVLGRGAQVVRGARLTAIRELYPGKASMQWLGMYGTGGGLYVGSHDTTLQTTALNAMLVQGADSRGDSLSAGFIKYPFCKPGETWRSEPFVLAVHSGTWHADARRYRAFADTWQNHAHARPQWVQEMPALHDIVMLHQHGRVRFTYDQIGEICDAAGSAGIDAVKLTGWADGGHDNKVPDFQPSPQLGGEERLAQNIRAARQRGFKIALYFHFVQMSPNSQFYARHGEFCQLKGPHGDPFIDVFTWPSNGSVIAMNERRQLINACVGTKAWQEHVLDFVRRGLAYGADCIFLDQTAGAPSSFLCFDARHGHRSPAYASGPGKTELSRKARELVDAAGPQHSLAAEYLADVILQYYDFTIPFGSGFFYEGQNFGEMFRYTFPEDVILTQYMSREDYEQLAYSFVMGYRFFLAPLQQCELITALKPEFVRRLAAMIRLRRKYADVLMKGRFVETVPLENPNPAIVARAYEMPAAPAYTAPKNGDRPHFSAGVAVWNASAEPQELAVRWPGKELLSIETLDGQMHMPDRSCTLPPGEVAVMIFR